MIRTATYYIVSARCYQVKSVTGSVLTKEDEEVWLGSSDGYPQWCRGKLGADHFSRPNSARAAAIQSDGMPWYCRIKPDSVRVFKADRRTVEEITETEEGTT